MSPNFITKTTSKGNKIFISIHEQGTEEWLNLRKGKLTSTGVGYIYGSPFKTVEDYALEFLGLKTSEFTSDAKERMKKGTENEPVARELFTNETGLEVSEVGLCYSEKDPKIGTSLDGLGDGFIIEIKCPEKVYWPLLKRKSDIECGIVFKKLDHSHIYDSHYLQMHTSMYIFDMEFCYYIVYGWGKQQLHYEKVYFNEEYWEEIRILINNFFGAILPKIAFDNCIQIPKIEFDFGKTE